MQLSLIPPVRSSNHIQNWTMKQTTLKSLNSGLQWKSIGQLKQPAALTTWHTAGKMLPIPRGENTEKKTEKNVLQVSVPNTSCRGVAVAIMVKSGHRAKLQGKICIFSACHSWLKALEAAGDATTSPGSGALKAMPCFQEVLSAEGFHFTSS